MGLNPMVIRLVNKGDSLRFFTHQRIGDSQLVFPIFVLGKQNYKPIILIGYATHKTCKIGGSFTIALLIQRRLVFSTQVQLQVFLNIINQPPTSCFSSHKPPMFESIYC